MSDNENLLYVADTQIGLLGEKYSLLALTETSAFDAYNSALTNLMLYLTTVNSHDFSSHFDTSFSVRPSVRPVELVRRENGVPR